MPQVRLRDEAQGCHNHQATTKLPHLLLPRVLSRVHGETHFNWYKLRDLHLRQG